MITGLLKQDEGSVTYEDGQKVTKWSKNIGLVPQDLAVYTELTAEENLNYFAALHGIKGAKKKKKVDETLEFVGLSDVRNKKVSEFSGGMKRRLNIACALVHDPKLIIMDEPTVGIDPQSRNYILERVLDLNKQGISVIYTSHYMEEVEKICDRIIILDKGKVILNDDKENIKNRFLDNQTITVMLEESANEGIKEKLEKIKGVSGIKVEDKKVECTYKVSINPLSDIIECLNTEGNKISNILLTEQDLETVFLSLTGKELRE